MKKDKEKLEELATKVAAKVVAITANINDKLHAEFLAATNIPIHPGVHNYVWLEIAYFGSYLLHQKVTNSMSKDEQIIFASTLRERFIFLVTTIVFPTEGEEDKSLKNYIESTYDTKLKKYSEFRGDISELFKNELKDTFNSQSDGKIKFVDKSFKTKIKLKAAFFLASLGNNKEFFEKHGDEFFFPDSILSSTVSVVTKMFRGAELKD